MTADSSDKLTSAKPATNNSELFNQLFDDLKNTSRANSASSSSSSSSSSETSSAGDARGAIKPILAHSDIDLASVFYASADSLTPKQSASAHDASLPAHLDFAVSEKRIITHAGDTFAAIAKNWTPSTLTGEARAEYLAAVERLNHLDHLTDALTLPKKLEFPGLTADGGLVVREHHNTVVEYANGNETVERGDKRGWETVHTEAGDVQSRYWGPNQQDNFVLTKTPKGQVEVADKIGDAPKQQVDDPKVAAERKHLIEMAEKQIKDPVQLAKFRADMARLEDRAKKSNLSPDEVAGTYKQIERLLNDKVSSKWSMSSNQRVILAEQVMSQAATPTSINQGQHETCNVTTVEARTYSLHPANAAKLVADVAIDASYRSAAPKPHGTLIHLNEKSLKPDDEARINPPRDGDRSFATQVFNVTAVNLVHRADRTGNVYGNDPDGGDETLYNRHKHKTVGHDPDLSDDQIVKAYDMVNGTDRRSDPVVMIDASDNVSGKGRDITKVNSEQQLMAKILEAKKNHQLPIILGVDANMEPFWTDSGHGAAGGSAGGHVVTITDITPGNPPMVSVDNQWGSDSDHLGARSVPLRELYIATHQPKDGELLLRHDVEQDRKNGKFDAWKELELARLQHFNKVGELDGHPAIERLNENKAYAEKLAQLISKASDQWAQQEKNGTLDLAEKEKAMKKIGDLIDDPNLPPPGQLKILKMSQEKGLITKEAYDNEVAKVMMEITDLKDADPGSTQEEKANYQYKQEEYKDALPALTNVIKGLPAAEQNAVLDSVLASDTYSDSAKFSMLRAIHQIGILSQAEYMQRAARVFHQLKVDEQTGAFAGKKGHRRDAEAKEQARLLTTELPADLIAKIKAAADKE